MTGSNLIGVANLIGALAAVAANVWAIRRGIPESDAPALARAILAAVFAAVFSVELARGGYVAPDITRSLALAAWWVVWIWPAWRAVQIHRQISRLRAGSDV